MTSLIVAFLWGGSFAAAMPPEPARTLAPAPPPSASHEPSPARYEFAQTEMAVPIELVLYAPSKEAATRGAAAVFARLHDLNALLSDYDSQSELSRLSRTSGEGKAVPVDEDLWNILVQAQAVFATQWRGL